jgi:hypothetical protein
MVENGEKAGVAGGDVLTLLDALLIVVPLPVARSSRSFICR